MDNEIGEGVELGVTLVIAVATLLVMSVLCGFARTAYINRTSTITRQNELLECASWLALYPKTSSKNIQGQDEESTFVSIETVCQWTTNHEGEYQVVLVDSHTMLSTGTLDVTRINYDKWNNYWYPNASGNVSSTNTAVYGNVSAVDIVDYLYEVNIARGLNNYDEAKYAQVTVYTADSYFYHEVDPAAYFNAQYVGQRTFDEYYALPKNAIIVFAVK